MTDLVRKRDRANEAAVQRVVDEKSQAPLKLAPPRTVTGTRVLRAELVRPVSAAKYGSSAERSETHNILFVDPATGASRWLLKTHRNVITYTEDISAFGEDAKADRALLGTVVLVKHAGADEDADYGELLLLDPSGAQVSSIGEKVRRVNATVAVSPAEFVIVFERGGRYQVARFESTTRRKLGESEINVPAIR